MEIITGVERRRRWRVADKLRILAEAEQPGVSFSDVARRHEISRGLLQTWRRLFEQGLLVERSPPMFLPVHIAENGNASAASMPVPSAPAAGGSGRHAGLMEIDLGGGRRVRVDRNVDTEALRRVLEALTSR
jgi:transposase